MIERGNNGDSILADTMVYLSTSISDSACIKQEQMRKFQSSCHSSQSLVLSYESDPKWISVTGV